MPWAWIKIDALPGICEKPTKPIKTYLSKSIYQNLSIKSWAFVKRQQRRPLSVKSIKIYLSVYQNSIYQIPSTKFYLSNSIEFYLSNPPENNDNVYRRIRNANSQRATCLGSHTRHHGIRLCLSSWIKWRTHNQYQFKLCRFPKKRNGVINNNSCDPLVACHFSNTVYVTMLLIMHQTYLLTKVASLIMRLCQVEILTWVVHDHATRLVN